MFGLSHWFNCMISYCLICIKRGQFHFFQHHLTTLTFMPSPDSYSGFYWEAVICRTNRGKWGIPGGGGFQCNWSPASQKVCSGRRALLQLLHKYLVNFQFKLVWEQWGFPSKMTLRDNKCGKVWSPMQNPGFLVVCLLRLRTLSKHSSRMITEHSIHLVKQYCANKDY